jgi:hypothetical protein
MQRVGVQNWKPEDVLLVLFKPIKVNFPSFRKNKKCTNFDADAA